MSKMASAHFLPPPPLPTPLPPPPLPPTPLPEAGGMPRDKSGGRETVPGRIDEEKGEGKFII